MDRDTQLIPVLAYLWEKGQNDSLGFQYKNPTLNDHPMDRKITNNNKNKSKYLL